MKNNSIEEIAKVLLGGEKIVLYPHIGMDGDAVGSCSALCEALLRAGKEASVYIIEDVPENLSFLCGDFFHNDGEKAASADISVCVDCGDLGRIKGREQAFLSAATTVCIDHHNTSDPFCIYNHIDGSQAATGQLIYKLIKAMNIEIKKETAGRIFAALLTDTGGFQYSNTQKETFDIASDLMDKGLNPNDVSVEIFENDRLEKIKIESMSIDRMRSLCGGKVLMAYVSQEMLEESGAYMNETNGIVSKLRSVRGVEVAVFVKEKAKNDIKISMRSKKYVDVSKIAAAFDGGGHVRAAGFSMECSLQEALMSLEKILEKEMEKYND